MRKAVSLSIIFLMLLGLAPAARFANALVGTKVVDGIINEWGTLDLVGTAKDNGMAGANLEGLYVAWDDQYLYLAIKTNNSAGWSDLNYGIGIDVDPGTGNGFTGPGDAWGKDIGFGNGYAIDYELYGYWNEGAGRLEYDWGTRTGLQFIKYTGNGWDYSWGNNFPDYRSVFTGDSATGLQTIEVAIPWSALGGKPERIALIAWITGGSGSAVSSAPWDAALEDSGDEWGDTDIFTNLAEVVIAPKTIDGFLDDWSSFEVVAQGVPSGVPGANLDKLYVSYDENYLYIAIKTNNTAKYWPDYGIAIDVNPGSGSGGTTDPWAKEIYFSGKYLPDYIIYAEAQDGQIVWMGMHNWIGSGWGSMGNVKDIGDYAYVGGNQGIQTIEIKIPWSAIGGRPPKLGIMAWAAGNNDHDSAVDTLPVDPEVDYPTVGNAEWTDTDVLSNFALIDIPVLKPDLTVSIKSDVFDVESWQPANITIEVSNIGKVDAKNVTVELYDDNTSIASWKVDVSAGDSVVINHIYTYSSKWGVHELRVVVDPENKIEEVNENNNEATFEIEVGHVQRNMNTMVKLAYYVWPDQYMAYYTMTRELIENASQLILTEDQIAELNALNETLNGIHAEYTEGMGLIGSETYALRGSSKVFHAYRTIRDFYPQVKSFYEYAKNSGVMALVSEVARSEEGLSGANVETLYLGYDSKYYYVAFDVNNTENWDIAYGIAVDAKEGGYKGMSDAWQRKVHFSYKPDYELYMFWSKDTGDITSADFAEWKDGNWEITPLNETEVFFTYKTGVNGLERVIVGIPLEYIPDPESAKVMVFAAGANPGDSLVDSVPYDASMADHDDEWSDVDIVTKYATVSEVGEVKLEGVVVDGKLNDWSDADVVAEDTENFGGEGANLKRLYVKYDSDFLYIALETDNTASWRIAYGIALDYTDGGATDMPDAWGRNIGFKRGVDAEMYFFWNGEFFGEKGTDSITEMTLAIWNGEEWEYRDLGEVALVAWDGGALGLKSLEIAIPWEAIGGKPEKIGVIAWVTGSNTGDSAVDSLPLDDAVKDSDNEWGDSDVLGNFAEVTIQ
ncbi:CARDB domain-containing protein [Palaeococcus ferrophilus]|uniref:CARDB domain-containing protein n=1 Tax=Palaeococcus ferrophilus TaxID=83868 RepID=UPI00069855B0|nr:CARDB domain-containing protein [Palaeococcus ferrophilus]